MNNREAIEYFHLLFSNRLAAKVDRKFFCLKGGCNLRFYFQSIRYSEDIDFDIHTTSVQTLKKNIEKILDDETFNSLLKHETIEIINWSAPKQTETTQRWKVSLKFGEQSLNIPTKIEFSRRQNIFEHTEISPIPFVVIAQYKMQNILLQHYTLEGAIEQKIQALIHRSETQARDILDLQILKNKLLKPVKITLSIEDKTKALETLMSVSFDHYKSQAWPFLITEIQEHYKDPKVWNQMQEEICDFIQKQMVQK